MVIMIQTVIMRILILTSRLTVTMTTQLLAHPLPHQHHTDLALNIILVKNTK